MRKTTSLVIAACSILLLPLTGCSANDPGTSGDASETSGSGSSVADGSSSKEGGVDSSEYLTQKVTAANEDGTAEVTITAPESWYSWGPGDRVKRGVILYTTVEVSDDQGYTVEVRDGWAHECTPENLSSQKCEIFGTNYLNYETLDPITIGGYDAPGFEYVDDLDTYHSREQYRLLDADGIKLSIAIKTSLADEEIPQLVLDVRDSLTVEHVD